MVEHQSGTLSKEELKELKEFSEQGPGTCRGMGPDQYDMWAKNPANPINQEKVEQLAADAHVPLIDIPPVIVGDESITQLCDLDTTDWIEKLEGSELVNTKDGALPRLRGLRRLAKPYIFREESNVNALVVVPREYVRTLETKNHNGEVMSISEVVGTHHFPMASVTFTIELVDGRVFSDSADAFYSNCEELGLYPTAVASARAEARCLRKVLGIKQHAAEEITNKDAGEELTPDDDQKINGAQIKLIEKTLKSLTDYALKDLLEEITTREIFAVDEMTTGEARKALKLLHDKKKAQKKKKK